MEVLLYGDKDKLQTDREADRTLLIYNVRIANFHPRRCVNQQDQEYEEHRFTEFGRSQGTVCIYSPHRKVSLLTGVVNKTMNMLCLYIF